MRYVSPAHEPVALASFLGAGLLVGLAPLQEIAARVAGRAGLGNFVAVNALLPLATAFIGVVFPRTRTAIVGGVLVVAGFLLARLVRHDARPWNWNLALLANVASPVLLGAAAGCAFIGALSALATRPFRVVGTAPHDPSCAGCGHALAESPRAATPDRCPECGADVGGARR
ncbi:MAG: hypothetical protein U0575_11145 [Phycisphaerales bacterium]